MKIFLLLVMAICPFVNGTDTNSTLPLHKIFSAHSPKNRHDALISENYHQTHFATKSHPFFYIKSVHWRTLAKSVASNLHTNHFQELHKISNSKTRNLPRYTIISKDHKKFLYKKSLNHNDHYASFLHLNLKISPASFHKNDEHSSMSHLIRKMPTLSKYRIHSMKITSNAQLEHISDTLKHAEHPKNHIKEYDRQTLKFKAAFKRPNFPQICITRSNDLDGYSFQKTDHEHGLVHQNEINLVTNSKFFLKMVTQLHSLDGTKNRSGIRHKNYELDDQKIMHNYYPIRSKIYQLNHSKFDHVIDNPGKQLPHAILMNQNHQMDFQDHKYSISSTPPHPVLILDYPLMPKEAYMLHNHHNYSILDYISNSNTKDGKVYLDDLVVSKNRTGYYVDKNYKDPAIIIKKYINILKTPLLIFLTFKWKDYIFKFKEKISDLLNMAKNEILYDLKYIRFRGNVDANDIEKIRKYATQGL